MRSTRYLLATLVLLLFLPFSEPVSAALYAVTDLGRDVVPAQINGSGSVVGTMMSSTGELQAFLYRKGVLTGLGLQGGTASCGLGINDRDAVVGRICTGDYCRESCFWGEGRAFLTKDGETVDLFKATGMTDAVRINNYGLILGSLYRTGEYHGAVVYDGRSGTITDVGRDIRFPEEGAYPIALNDRGQAVVGQALCGSPECTTSYLVGDRTVEIAGDPDAPFVTAWDINDHGQVVGGASFWDEIGMFKGILFHKGALEVFPDTAAHRFVPQAINNHGVMVGHLWGADYVLRRVPAIGSDGRFATLQASMLDTADQWSLVQFFDINDRGDIVGYGTKNGEERHGFILSPAPERQLVR